MEQTNDVKMRKLEVIVKNRENKVTHKKFHSYAVKMKDGKWIDARFTCDVEEDVIPQSYSYIYVYDDKMNIDEHGAYPKLWIRHVDHVEPIERPLEDLDQYFE